MVPRNVLDAERGKFTRYADKPDGFSIVPAVIGMHGEVGGQLTVYLAGLATSAAERERACMHAARCVIDGDGPEADQAVPPALPVRDAA